MASTGSRPTTRPTTPSTSRRTAKSWATRYRVTGGNGGRDYIYLPESDARFVRLRSSVARPTSFGLREITVEPLEWAASKNAFFAAVARDAAPGSYPKYLSGVQSYWTVAGVDGDQAEVLVNEEGMVEARKGGFSIEPFVYVDGKLFTWRDVKTTQSLAGGHFPEPTSRGTAATGSSRSRRSPCSAAATRRSRTCSTASRTGARSDARATVPRGSAVPGESVLAVPQHAGRRRDDSRSLPLENQTVQVNGETVGGVAHAA